ncbi:hypothetical protein PVBG_05486 [Plasmodium vivax Brazil I]|uniref:Uncharacterized protein n=2 Tax=Plasmodium vivax TaxID=5855 RepID=A0A0J9SVE4_PLAV1|nr:hypothetical protein PVBG_05486 [Plasmodium vivax Brazil I]
MRITSYNDEKIFHTYKGILEAWNNGLGDQILGHCIISKQGDIEAYVDTFKSAQCLQAQHYLSNVETNIDPQYKSNACQYFLYWLYYEVLEKKLDKHKILKIYNDMLTGYMEGSLNYHLRDYVNLFSEKPIEKFIKLTEMYDYFYKFKEDMKRGDKNKCDNATKCVGLYNENIELYEKGNDYNFCYELDNLKENYDAYMKANECCPSLTKTLKSHRVYNPAIVIITPFSILLVISLSLFFLYKVNYILF